MKKISYLQEEEGHHCQNISKLKIKSINREPKA
jgi:hypothetical protein